MGDLNYTLNFTGMVFEIFIIAIAAILLLLIINKYFVKKHKLTLMLFFIFLLYFLAIFFSWLSKVLIVTYFPIVNDGSVVSWFLFRIVDFRLSEFFVTIAIAISYVLKVNIFEKGYNSILRIIVIAYGSFTGFFVLVIYEHGNVLLDVFAFLLVFVFMGMIYFPFLVRAINSYRSVDDPIFKKGFLALAIMSISFTLIFLNFAIDRVLILFGSPGFTVFYFLAWICGIIGILGAYFGYIRPKSK